MPPRPPVPDAAAPPLAVALGQATRRLRERAGHGQERFADVVGLHRTAMSAFERGVTDPKLGTVEKVARGLGIATSDLLREAEQEQSTPGRRSTTTRPLGMPDPRHPGGG